MVSDRDSAPSGIPSASLFERSNVRRMSRIGLLGVTGLALLALALPASAAEKAKTATCSWSATTGLTKPTWSTRTSSSGRAHQRDPRRPGAPGRDRRRSASDLLLDNIRNLVGEGHNQYVDDGFTSLDGKLVYFSRPSFADVVAINLKSERIVWRTRVDGYRADHMAISRNGRRLLVSSSTANVIDVIDTRTGAIIGRIPSGDSPHENNFSEDGKPIYHASIGLVYTDTDDPSQDVPRNSCIRGIDARTLEVLRTIDMGQKLAEAGYPGMSLWCAPDGDQPGERYVYFQVSFFFGIVKYDLKQDRVASVLHLPLADAEGLRAQSSRSTRPTTASITLSGRSSASPGRCPATRRS